MPQDNLVPCFHVGSDRSGSPDFLKERSELRVWRNENKGYFVDHGKAFQMMNPVGWQDRGVSSATAAVAFSRIQNPLQKPSVVNYPIPALGDHRLRWLNSFMVSESMKAECY